jgi:protoporphyrinogen/coproporphyrinogen III oxidase
VIRFGRLLWRVKSDDAIGYLGSADSRIRGGRYDSAPLSHYFTQEFCERIIRPMTVRMNGAEPDEAYLGNFASNIRMLLDTYEQFTHGLAPLLSDFCARYDVRLNTVTEGLLVNDGRVTGVRVRYPNGTRGDLHGAGVVLATPASVAADLTQPILSGLARELRSISYFPVTPVIAEYDRPVFSSTARAFVFDGREVVSNAGAYGFNDLHLVRYTFSGRRYRQYMSKTYGGYTPASLDADALLRLGEAALSRHVPVVPARRRRLAVRHFSPGLCAYAPYHGRFLDRVEEELNVGGLYLTGDYMQGASIEACFRSASACADRIARREQ